MVELVNSSQGDPMFCADLHVHTTESDGRATVEETIDLAEVQGLDAIAITDHNKFHPGQEGAQYVREKGSSLTVIPGSEINTEAGHLVVLFQQAPIQARKSVEWTIKQAHEQGALVMAVHPLFIRSSLGYENLMAVLTSPDEDVYFDMFEVDNFTLHKSLHRDKNDQAYVFYQEFQARYPEKIGAAVGNTDNHWFGVGRSRTWYNGELTDAIRTRQTLVGRMTSEEDMVATRVDEQVVGERAYARINHIAALRRERELTNAGGQLATAV